MATKKPVTVNKKVETPKTAPVKTDIMKDEPVKAAAPVKAETPAKTETVNTSEIKKTAEPVKAEVKKPEVKAAPAKAAEKAAPVKAAEKATPAKVEEKAAPAKAAPKKPAAKKAIKASLYVQALGKEISEEEAYARVKAAWKATGHKAGDLKEMTVYVKPEENSIYYVVNGDVTGRVDF